ncbi:hypothetical protein QFC21_002531 [Naganishia friedmannii]|uniref:Uncharacterized protein n=1 Tax=Naganishia friedmannii TaxID=89922 RepID=A0ACC2VVS6_9TREE|nr:hypothetical protein QFC21_002531 [Naganishia friedmannii]
MPQAKRHYYTACGGLGEPLSWDSSWYTEAWFTDSQASYDAKASSGAVDPPPNVYATDPACIQLVSSAADAGITALPVTPTGDIVATSTGVDGRPTATIIATGVIATSSVSLQASGVISSSTLQPQTAEPSITAGKSVDPAFVATCAGQTFDYQAWGSVLSLVFGLLIGLLVWMVWIALKRKRTLVGVYKPRTWFVDRSNRPTITTFWSSLALSSLLSFKTPLSSDPSELPSDAHLSSLAILAVLKGLLWSTLIALIVALPLFLVGTPCIDLTSPKSSFGGHLGTLTDMSILRLLNALDPDPRYTAGTAADNGINVRALASTIQPDVGHSRMRLIILVAIASIVIFLPSILLLARTLRRLLLFRQKWLKQTCGAEEIVFLPVARELQFSQVISAPTEQDVRMLATGLRLWDEVGVQEISGAEGNEPLKARVSIRAVFAIPRTIKLDQMLERRNGVLERLKIAETRFIRSFKANLPRPSATIDDEETDKDGAIVWCPNAKGSLSRNLSVNWNHGKKNSRDANILEEPKPANDIRTPSGYVAPRKLYEISSAPQIPVDDMMDNFMNTKSSNSGSQRDRRRKATFAKEVEGRITGTQFQEVYRESLMPGGGLPPVGTPLDIERGKFVIQPRVDTEKDLPPPPTECLSSEESKGTSSQLTSSPKSRATRNTMRSTSSSNYNTALFSWPTRPQPPGSRMSSGYPRIPDHTGTLVNQPLLDNAKPDPKSLGTSRTKIQPPIRPVSGITPRDLSSTYSDINEYRSLLKELNEEVVELQATTYEDMMIGKDIVGFFLIGRSLSKIPGAVLIEGMARDDVDWARLGKNTRKDVVMFWFICVGLTTLACASNYNADDHGGGAVIPFIGLANSTGPGLSHYLGFLRHIANSDGPGNGIVQGIVPSIGIALIIWILKRGINLTGRRTRTISKTATEYRTAKATCISFAIVAVWLVIGSGLVFAVEAFDHKSHLPRYIADGIIHSSWWLFCLLLNLAIVTPALLLLRAVLAYRRIRMHRKVETPRQRFQAFLPCRVAYQGMLATCVFAAALVFPMLPIFPLIGLPAVVFLVLLFVASRYLATFADCSLFGSSGGRLAILLIRSLAVVLLCQPVLLGLILLSRREWAIGGASLGVALAGLMLFEGLLVWRKGRSTALSRTEHAKFRLFAKRLQSHAVEPIDNMSIDRPSELENSGRRRRSNATIFELMSDLLLPSNQTRSQGHLPLKTENIDTYLDPYRANLAHPDINQNQHELPPLSLRENENLDMAKYQAENTMYPPGLIMPAPVIWLPDDKMDVGKQEVEDLRRFHRLSAMLDAVRS